MKKHIGLVSFLVAAVLMVPGGHVILDSIRREKLNVRAVVGEAADQGEAGMLAVSEGIRNRGTLKGVKGLNRDVSKELPETWTRARRAWRLSFFTNITGGATHWASTKFPAPYWTKSMVSTARINDHVFYRERKS